MMAVFLASLVLPMSVSIPVVKVQTFQLNFPVKEIVSFYVFDFQVTQFSVYFSLFKQLIDIHLLRKVNCGGTTP